MIKFNKETEKCRDYPYISLPSGNDNYFVFSSLFMTCIPFLSALPDPIIDVTTNGSTEAGQTFSLICTVIMASDLTPRPNVTWIKFTGGSTEFPIVTQETTSITTTFTISFSPLTFSHRGQYRCLVNLIISTVLGFAGSEDYNILVDCELNLSTSISVTSNCSIM